MPKRTPAPALRFAASYEVTPSGCWQWTRLQRGGGYGSFAANGKTYRAHRWSYEYFIGPIPDGLEIDHLCRNRLCVNPAHLEAVTRQVNIERRLPYLNLPKKSHCKYGHEYTPENTILVLRKGRNVPERRCRTCFNQRQRDLRRRSDTKAASRARQLRRLKAKGVQPERRPTPEAETQ